MTEPDPHVSPRRAARATAGRRGVPRWARLALAGAVAVALVGGLAWSLASAVGGAGVPETAGSPASASLTAPVVPMPAEGLPVPVMSGRPQAGAVCDDPVLAAALASGDDAAAIAAAGGGAAFRELVASGAAPCIRLDDPRRVWIVVNKQRAFDPIDFGPDALVMPEGVRSLEESALRRDAADALSAMVRAAQDAGAGEIASESAYRSYTTQQTTYAGHVADRGVEGADLVSARPGHSEHQSGLAVDVVPCDGGCATIDDLAGSAQGDWVAAHAWEHGYIVRYAPGRTDVTGYVPEPWHLRYIGADLARAYHDGGWTTLEEFFALPPAPGY